MKKKESELFMSTSTLVPMDSMIVSALSADLQCKSIWSSDCRNKTGILGWRSEKTEVVNGYESKVLLLYLLTQNTYASSLWFSSLRNWSQFYWDMSSDQYIYDPKGNKSAYKCTASANSFMHVLGVLRLQCRADHPNTDWPPHRTAQSQTQKYPYWS